MFCFWTKRREVNLQKSKQLVNSSAGLKAANETNFSFVTRKRDKDEFETNWEL
jgi:hypothetical protein